MDNVYLTKIEKLSQHFDIRIQYKVHLYCEKHTGPPFPLSG
jgi:hypothetical protein